MSSNSKTFYDENIKKIQNLSVDEQIQLIKEYQQGSKEAKNILIGNNIGYIIFAVKQKFGIDDCDCEDLINIGIIGLIKGINTYNLENKLFYKEYNIEKSIKLTTFLITIVIILLIFVIFK